MASDNTPLDQYVRPIVDHRRVAVATTALVTIVALAMGLAAPKSYSSNAAVLVYPVEVTAAGWLEADDTKIDMPTELRIASSQAVLSLASAKLTEADIIVSPKELDDGLTVSTTRESSMLDITFSTNSATRAQSGANAVADAYLQFRSELADRNKNAAATAVDARIVVLSVRLGALDEAIDQVRGGTAEQLELSSARDAVETELAALTASLAALSTPTVDATTVIDRAERPVGPDGLGPVPIAVGSLAAGLVAGVMAAFGAATLKTMKRGPKTAAATATETDEPTLVSQVSEPKTGNNTETTETEEEPAEEEVLVQTNDPVEADTHKEIEVPTEIKVEPTELKVEPTADDGTAVAAFDQIVTAMGLDDPVDLADEPVADPAAEAPATATDDELAKDSAGSALADYEQAATASMLGPNRAASYTIETADDPASDPERRDLYTVVPADADRRQLQPTEVPQKALVAAADVDAVIEQLQEFGRSGPVVGLTLGEEGVGTSIAVAFDLADALQSLGARVLVIDASIDDPLLAELLGEPTTSGLAEAIVGDTALADAVRQIGGLEGLDALTAGDVSDSTAEAVLDGGFERLLEEAKLSYHAILVIAGSVDGSTVATLAGLADGIIVGTTQKPGRQAGSELCRQLAALPAPTLEFLSEQLVVERADDEVGADSISM